MAMDQFVNQAAKNRYMFGGQARLPVVFRSAMFYRLHTAPTTPTGRTRCS